MSSSEPPALIQKPIETTDSITVRPGDSVLVLRSDGAVDIYCHTQAGKELNIGSLTALGLYWSLEQDEWRIRMCKKAKTRVEDMIAGRDQT